MQWCTPAQYPVSLSKNMSMGPVLIGCPDYDNEVINIVVIVHLRGQIVMFKTAVLIISWHVFS